jgi:poly-gamma-glutamate capsule biosynthesis protein CapA/YwtB (metallophosphatase superfamily)
MFERFVHAGLVQLTEDSVWVSACLMAWVVDPICGHSAHGVVEVQVILKNECVFFFGNFGPGRRMMC